MFGYILVRTNHPRASRLPFHRLFYLSFGLFPFSFIIIILSPRLPLRLCFLLLYPNGDMDGWRDTVCPCRDPLLSTHSGWVKAFGFFHWKSKSCSASGEWGIGFPSPGILSNMYLRRYSCYLCIYLLSSFLSGFFLKCWKQQGPLDFLGPSC